MFPHERAEAALNALTEEASDAQIAVLIADYLLVGKSDRDLLTIWINHDPKIGPCPVKVDKTHVGAKKCSISIRGLDDARAWIAEALCRGYELHTGTRRGQEYVSIARQRNDARSRRIYAEYKAKRQERKDRGEDPDDDIPF